MPKKKKTITIEEGPDEKEILELEGVGEETPEDKEAREIESWTADFQAKFSEEPVKVSVEKFRDSEWLICKKYPLASFDPEIIRKEWGPGRYRARLLDQRYHYIKGTSNTFEFAEPAGAIAPAPAPENPLENPVIALMLKSMESNQAMLVNLMQAMVTGGAAKAPERPLNEIVDVMSKLHQMAPKDKPMDSFKEMLTSWKLVQEVTGSKDSESKGGLMSEVREFLELAPLLKEQLPTIKSMLPPGPVQSSPAPASPVQEKKEMDPLTIKIISLVPKFVEAARTDSSIEEWGDYLLAYFESDIVPLLLPQLKAQYKALVQNEDDVYDIVIRLAKDPAERETIYKRIVPLAPYKDWCNRVIDEAIRLCETEEAPENSGDPSDPPGPTGGGNAILQAVHPNGKDKLSH